MAEQHTMSELLQATTEGYGDVIVILAILADNFELKNVPNEAIKLMLFPFSLDEAAWIWLEKEPPRSILTWQVLISNYVNQFFPHSNTTNLKNDITRFQQKSEETFSEAWDHFKDLLPAGRWSIAADYLVSNRYPGVRWVSHIGPWPNVRTVYGSGRDPLLDKCPGRVVILYVIMSPQSR
nr:reverse transcriptase domain-containing protein [Tanacetum cinerariifolium]